MDDQTPQKVPLVVDFHQKYVLQALGYLLIVF